MNVGKRIFSIYFSLINQINRWLMRIGIPKETLFEEKRVALAPAGVDALVRAGHSVYIQNGAGDESSFHDLEYQNVGATVVYSLEEVFQRSELVAKITPLTETEADILTENQILFSFLHLALGKKRIIQKLLSKNITAISYELIEDNDRIPVLQSMSEIAGQIALHIGEKYLKSDIPNSRGILIGGISGVAPAAVVILGAGVVGFNAARAAIGRGAQVIVLDKDAYKLRRIQNILGKNITTVVANPFTIARGVKFADVLIGAIQVSGIKSPHVVTEEMVKTMKKGAVIIDISIDQGGCVETSYPTSISDPVFVKHNVIHYCVPNIPALVSRTASYGLTNTSIKYLMEIAENGLTNALLGDEGLANGVCFHQGACSNIALADIFDLDYKRLHIFSSN